MKGSRHFGVTQKDVADALDISRASVAIALNPKTRHKLRPATCSKIEAKAREMNYRPQRQARILRSGRSHTIGLVGVLGHYHAPQERFRYLMQGAIQAGYRTVFADMEWFEGRTTEAQNYLLDMAVEGIIFCNITTEQGCTSWQQFTRKHSLPMLSMSGMFEEADQASFDFCSAYRKMTLHHMAQGARSLVLQLPFHDALPAEARPAASLQDRVDGFVGAIHSAGGEVIADGDAAGLFQLPSRFSTRSSALRGRVHYPRRTDLYRDAFDVGYHEANRILNTEDADAFVCSNDDIATGVMSACIQRGIRIPETMRISGCDDSLYVRHLPVPLTSMKQPPHQMVEWSIQRIIELIENPGKRGSIQKQKFPCELIFRKSTMCTSLN